jgi:hypothetical protein
MPPGSLPGMSSFAIAPTIKPMMSAPINENMGHLRMNVSLFAGKGYREVWVLGWRGGETPPSEIEGGARAQGRAGKVKSRRAPRTPPCATGDQGGGRSGKTRCGASLLFGVVE